MSAIDFLASNSGIASIIGAVITAIVALQTTFLKWLVDRFDKLATAIDNSSNRTNDWLTDHEDKDQKRHEENLYRFEKIAVALAKLGHYNGSTLHN